MLSMWDKSRAPSWVWVTQCMSLPALCMQVAAEADVLYQTRIQKERFQVRSTVPSLLQFAGREVAPTLCMML